jgi:hypothetical protein
VERFDRYPSATLAFRKDLRRVFTTSDIESRSGTQSAQQTPWRADTKLPRRARYRLCSSRHRTSLRCRCRRAPPRLRRDQAASAPLAARRATSKRGVRSRGEESASDRSGHLSPRGALPRSKRASSSTRQSRKAPAGPALRQAHTPRNVMANQAAPSARRAPPQ